MTRPKAYAVVPAGGTYAEGQTVRAAMRTDSLVSARYMARKLSGLIPGVAARGSYRVVRWGMPGQEILGTDLARMSTVE